MQRPGPTRQAICIALALACNAARTCGFGGEQSIKGIGLGFRFSKRFTTLRTHEEKERGNKKEWLTWTRNWSRYICQAMAGK